MTDIKINCACGQHYVFSVEPKDGNLRGPIPCPACGKDGTADANAKIALLAVTPAPAKPVPPPAVPVPVAKKAAVPIFVFPVVALVLGILAGGGYYWYSQRETTGTSGSSTSSRPMVTTPKPKVKNPGGAHYAPDTKEVGVGMLVYKKEGVKKFLVGQVFRKSPAAKAEIRVGDMLNKLNGEEVDDLSLSDVATKIVGPIGSTVSVEMINKAGETNKYEMTRILF